MKTYFRVSIPSSNRVGAGTMKTFLTRREAEEFLKAEHAQGVGVIEEANDKGRPIYRNVIQPSSPLQATDQISYLILFSSTRKIQKH